MRKSRGVVAAGHKETAKSAEIILREGGNAFDAVVAAHFAACVVEPVLSSLGGGSFLLAGTSGGQQTLYDFFVQTPKHKRSQSVTDFYPISADFGTVQQEFHIGLGSIATPGVVKGLFTVHDELCSMPMSRLVEPAIKLARDGVEINPFQAYIFDVVHPIYESSRQTLKNYSADGVTDRLAAEGEVLKQPELADLFEVLSQEGEALFYQGEIANQMVRQCRESGGHLTKTDLASYQVIKRNPLSVCYRNTKVLTNPPPSSGGLLMAFALKLLEDLELEQYGFGSARHLDGLAAVLGMTNKARIEAQLDDTEHRPNERLLSSSCLADYKQQIKGRPFCSRGTTHLSIMDREGNIAALTTTNGEGCGHLISGTGVMLNNMLGEEDLNPHGFFLWPQDCRMTSMVAPSILLLPGDKQIALGSGGSNRLRTAILQVLINRLDFGMNLEQAINSPRLHYENDRLSIENGFDPVEIEQLLKHYPDHRLWPDRNLFFGGVHSVERNSDEFIGIGDPRRGGVSLVV